MDAVGPKASVALAAFQVEGGAAARAGEQVRESAERGDAQGTREAARRFEAWFVQSMMKEMRKASGSEDGLFSGPEMETFGALFDEEIAARVADGPGIGLAAVIERSLAVAYGGGAGEGSSAEALGVQRTRRSPLPALSAAQVRAGFCWPLPESEPGRISSGFGSRIDPLAGALRRHAGLDIAAPGGTPILAVASGRVVRAEQSATLGHFVEIEHADGVTSRYAHQAAVDVSVGDEVRAGEQIGKVGSSGRSTGDHLHLEVRVSGRAVDPRAFLAGQE